MNKGMDVAYFRDLDTSTMHGMYILLDIDGTLVPDGAERLGESERERVKVLQQANTVYLCSNKPLPERNRDLAKELGLQYLDTEIRKPSKKVFAYLQVVAEQHIDPKQVMIIGDKYVTDGLCAHFIGAGFVKVRRLKNAKERLKIRFIYLVDDIAYKLRFLEVFI